MPPWKPGQSGNPKGKPKGARSFRTIFKEMLEREINTTDPVTKLPVVMKIKDALVLRMIGKALKDGDLPIFQHIEAELLESIVKDTKTDREELSVKIYNIIQNREKSKSTSNINGNGRSHSTNGYKNNDSPDLEVVR